MSTTTKPKNEPPTINFEVAMDELEQMVTLLEQGHLSLDDSLKHFEKGVALIHSCRQVLNAAEQRVRIVMEKNGEAALQPFSETQNTDVPLTTNELSEEN